MLIHDTSQRFGLFEHASMCNQKGGVKIQNRGPEQEIPAVTCVRLEGLRGFSAFFKQSAAIDIEMGINLRQAWGTIRREVGEPATGIFSVGPQDLPGSPKERKTALVFRREPRT